MLILPGISFPTCTITPWLGAFGLHYLWPDCLHQVHNALEFEQEFGVELLFVPSCSKGFNTGFYSFAPFQNKAIIYKLLFNLDIQREELPQKNNCGWEKFEFFFYIFHYESSVNTRKAIMTHLYHRALEVNDCDVVGVWQKLFCAQTMQLLLSC